MKSKVQKISPRLRKLLMQARRIFEREYPGRDVVIQPVFLKGNEIRRLCKKSGKSRRFAVSIVKRGKRWVVFDIGLDKMPDDFVLFHFLHELIHAGLGETNETKAISMTFGALKKLGINRDDFMRRYRQFLVKTF